jgi:hypothetical protein
MNNLDGDGDMANLLEAMRAPATDAFHSAHSEWRHNVCT